MGYMSNVVKELAVLTSRQPMWILTSRECIFSGKLFILICEGLLTDLESPQCLQEQRRVDTSWLGNKY